MGITYDTGALIAAESNRLDVWAAHKNALHERTRLVVLAPVLAQAWRGGPQPLLSRFLLGCRKEPMTEELAREAGRACALAGTSDVVDATVVVWALAHDDVVVTSDEDDLKHLADALGGRLKTRSI